VDNQEACRIYEGPNTKILIGDQGSTDFWKDIKSKEPCFDVIIDDGSHNPVDQRVTFESLITHLNPGGIYICEDIHHSDNPFYFYLTGTFMQLNGFEGQKESTHSKDCDYLIRANELQSFFKGLHLYPYMAVVEMHDEPISHLSASKRGSQWQPFSP
jgi:hypothetical protein